MVFILLIGQARGGCAPRRVGRDEIGGTNMGKELEQMLQRREAILAGDTARIKAQHDAGKLTARERIDKLLGAEFTELDQLAAGGESGVVTGYGVLGETPVYVWAQDYTVKGGAISACGANKVIKLLDLAKKAGKPVVALLDSAGARLDEGVCGLAAFARILGKVAELSGVVPQIALVLGPVMGGSAMVAAQSDFIIQAECGYMLSNGPQIIASAHGKPVDPKALGGIDASARAGLSHITCKTEDEAFELAAKVVNLLPLNSACDDDLVETGDDYAREIPALNDMDVCDMRAAIKAIADNGDVIEVLGSYAERAVTALGRLGDRAVGFVAASGRVCPGMCQKIARFVRTCDSFNLPVVTLCDVEGFSYEAESAAMIKAQTQLMFATAEATVPKVAVITGKAMGAAYMALASKEVCDIAFAWPQASAAPLDAPATVQMMHGDELVGAANPAAKRAELESAYLHDVVDGINAAKCGQVDAVIVPSDTRKDIIGALETLEGKREERAPRKHGNMPL